MGFFKEQDIDNNRGLKSAAFVVGELLTRLEASKGVFRPSPDEEDAQILFPLPLADPVAPPDSGRIIGNY